VPPAAAELGAHVEACGPCRAAVDDYRRISREVAALAASPAPAPRLDAIRGRAASAAREERETVRWLQRVAAAAALVLIASGLFVLWPTGGASGRESENSGDLASRTVERDHAVYLIVGGPVWRVEPSPSPESLPIEEDF
jgi:anti-sigma factor RsiW